MGRNRAIGLQGQTVTLVSMKRRFSKVLSIIAVLCGLLGLPGAAEAAQRDILVLGDSLSAAYGIDAGAGWVSLLRQRLQDQGYPYRVINASVSGDTTSGGLQRLPQALQQHHPAILIVELGGSRRRFTNKSCFGRVLPLPPASLSISVCRKNRIFSQLYRCSLLL